MPWTRLGIVLVRTFSSQTVGLEVFTKQSSATSPQATAGVFWWTQDGPFLEPPQGNIIYQGRYWRTQQRKNHLIISTLVIIINTTSDEQQPMIYYIITCHFLVLRVH